MAEKPTFVDLITEATRHRWRRAITRAPKPEAEDKPHVSRWPPPRQAEWRLELLKPWRFRDRG